VSDAVAAVLMKEPDWTALPATTPAHIRDLIRRCLQKDVQKRVPNIAVARLEIDEGASVAAPVTAAATAQPLWRRAIPIAAAVLLTAGLAAALWWRFRPETSSPIVTRFQMMLPEGQSFTNAGRQVLAISPEGTQIVYSANQRLYLRAMLDLEPRPIPGIDGSYPVISPVFSPDGRSIVFWSGAEEVLKRIAVTGGAPVTIAAATNPVGMSWGADGILFGQATKGVLRVSPNGGTPEVVVSIKGDEIAHGPQMLPAEGASVHACRSTSDADRWDKAKIVVQSLASGERKVLIDGGSDARYLPDGHIVYALSGVVLAVPFDVRSLQVSGGPVPVVEGVRRSGGGGTGTAQFSVAANGITRVYPGTVSTTSEIWNWRLIDRKGVATSPR
jgi:hypothetical protein